MMVQSKGMVLHDMAKITSSDFPFDVVAPQSPIRIAPLASSASSGEAAAVVLPELWPDSRESGLNQRSLADGGDICDGKHGRHNDDQQHDRTSCGRSNAFEFKIAVEGNRHAAAAPAVHYTRLRLSGTDSYDESWPKISILEKSYVENRLKPDYVRRMKLAKKDG